VIFPAKEELNSFYRTGKSGGQVSLLEAFEQVLAECDYEMILEFRPVRILPRKDALTFWTLGARDDRDCFSALYVRLSAPVAGAPTAFVKRLLRVRIPFSAPCFLRPRDLQLRTTPAVRGVYIEPSIPPHPADHRVFAPCGEFRPGLQDAERPNP